MRVGHWTDARARTALSTLRGARADLEALAAVAVELTAEAIRRAAR